MNKNYDKRGEEINYNVNMAIEEPDIENCYKEYDNENRYDECIEKDSNYDFKIGDEVITSTGEVGRIIDICICDLCKRRGFYEPRVEFIIGGARYISNNDKKDNFCSYYKIGDKIELSERDTNRLSLLAANKKKSDSIIQSSNLDGTGNTSLRGVYKKMRNEILMENGFHYVIKNKMEDLYDDADVVFELEEDLNNPRYKKAVNVRISD